MSTRRRRAMSWLVLSAALLGTALPSAGQPLSPAQVAGQQAQLRQIDERFVRAAAAATGVSLARVRAAMPAEGRLVAPLPVLVPALEEQLGRALTASEQAALQAADAERRTALGRLPPR